MAGIPKEFIDTVLRRSSIVDVIGKHTTLKKHGREYSGLCPFHKEKTPSFSVNEENQVYHCHGCGEGGNLITFMRKYENHDFREAIEILARKLGMSVPQATPEESRRYASNQSIYTCLQDASVWYEKQLREHAQKTLVVDYLRKRGLEGKCAQDFKVGFAPANGNNLLNALGKQDSDQIKMLERAGLVKHKDDQPNAPYDVFINRIIFPVRDPSGRVIAFGGRALNPQTKAKYINSPETAVYKKGDHLYGLYETLQHKDPRPYLLIVEGYMDVLICHQFGIRNTVATLGTAINTRQMELAFRYSDKLIFCFDGDKAGRKAAERVLKEAMQIIDDGREIAFLLMPEGQDPDSFLRSAGIDAMRQLISKALPLSKMLLRTLDRDVDLESIEGRASLKNGLFEYLNMLKPCAFKKLLIREAADLIGLNATDIETLLSDSQQTPHEVPPTANNDHPPAPPEWATELSTDTPSHEMPPHLPMNEQTAGSTIKPSLPWQLLALLLYDPTLARSCDAQSLEALTQWPVDDITIEPLMDALNYLNDHPSASIHEMHVRYNEKYAQYPSITKLLEPVQAFLKDIAELKERQSSCQELLSNLLTSIQQYPQKIARRQRLREASRSMQNI